MPTPSSPLEELSDSLWQVRRLLDLLRFRLEEERVLARAGGRRWVATAHRDVDDVLDRLRIAELVRAIGADEVARTLGLGTSPTLRQVADAAPPPWGGIFRAHRDALLAATQAVAELAAAIERLAALSPEQAPRAARLGPSLLDFLADWP